MFLGPTPDKVREAYSLLEGVEVTRQQIADIGWQCLEDEWEFNRLAGFDAADDDLPACLREEGIGPDHALKFTVSPEVIAQAKVRLPLGDRFFAGAASG